MARAWTWLVTVLLGSAVGVAIGIELADAVLK
jgi:hypothetical protein